MIIMVIGSAVFMGAHRKGTFDMEKTKNIPEEKERLANHDSTLLFLMKILSLAVTCVSAAIFFSTEMMNDEAPLTNRFSLIHIILLAVFIVVLVVGNREANKVDPMLRDKKPKDEGFFLD